MSQDDYNKKYFYPMEVNTSESLYKLKILGHNLSFRTSWISALPLSGFVFVFLTTFHALRTWVGTSNPFS